MKKDFILFLILILSVSSIDFIYAVPGIPHQFYGNVEINGKPSDGVIKAVILTPSQEYSTIISEGVYGVNPNTFFIEDPDNDNSGKEIIFYVGEKEAGRYTFKNTELTKLDFSLTTFCGDNFCMGDESCSDCSADCGICTGDNEITIFSPVNKIYNNSKIDLQVYSKQDVSVWMYSLNSETPRVFTPNITLTLYDGAYNLTVIAVDNAYQSTSKTISFSVDIPYDYCGDGLCNFENGETCSTCNADCKECSSGSSSSSSGSGGKTKYANASNQLNETNEIASVNTLEIVLTNPELKEEEKDENENELALIEQTGLINDKSKGFFPGITGAVISFGENLGSLKIILIFTLFLCLIIVLLFLIKKAKRRKEKTSEY